MDPKDQTQLIRLGAQVPLKAELCPWPSFIHLFTCVLGVAGFESLALLLLPPKCWDYRDAPPCLADTSFCSCPTTIDWSLDHVTTTLPSLNLLTCKMTAVPLGAAVRLD